MKKNKETIEQLKKKTVPELAKEATELRAKLWSLERDLESGKVKNVGEIRDVRRMIARVLTETNSR